SDVPALLSAMDVYGAPSAEETFGLSVVEALCAGLPAVVGACPAIDGLSLRQVERCHDGASLSAGLRSIVRRVEDGQTAAREAPAEIVTRMDIVQVAASVDNLYQDVGMSRRRYARAP